tara:strand:- start:2727 stop:2954 length:228 start_codon:yes stop_codon:yes gene_type:complete
MNDIDLWNEAESLTEEKDEKLQKIGWSLFDLYDRAYNNHYEDENLNKVVEYNIWNIYDDIWNGITFKDSLSKHKE